MIFCVSLAPSINATIFEKTNNKESLEPNYGGFFKADVSRYKFYNLGEVLKNFLYYLDEMGLWTIQDILEFLLRPIIRFTQQRPFYLRQLNLDVDGLSHWEVWNFQGYKNKTTTNQVMIWGFTGFILPNPDDSDRTMIIGRCRSMSL